jgi:ribosomal protein S18 acetylase RimI-like enzyme
MMNLVEAYPDDREFLYKLYVDTRKAEVDSFGWEPKQAESFLQMQFNAQQRSYEMQYPELDHQLVVWEEQPVGHIMTAATADALVLVDVVLLEEHRSKGIGTNLIIQLQKRAQEQRKAVRLQVFQHNRAEQLYQRLGFQVTSHYPPYKAMQWNHDLKA